ncbi:MAG: discoidin domain-containing protein, partial [Nitrososphaeraceae archaeon]|nr:discoidin domain-containing protein [Nitrososphaeraceae archaeon]
MISQTIHPTSGQGTTSTCVDTNITSIAASGSSQNFPPNNVVDKNFNTLWSIYGKGSWIQLDLGSSKNICSVNIAWYKGDTRESNFVISTSTDGTIYKNVLSSKSSGNTLSFDKYVIPSTLARYVKIIVNGNTQNDYASITEVKLQTTSLTQPVQTQCSTATIDSVKASGSATGYPSSYVIDNNLQTRWSNNGKGSWIQLDLGSSKNICSVNIAWFKGNERQSNFVISTSKDGTTFTKVLEKKSSGTTLNLEEYVLPNPNARYIKIIVNGNTQNDYASITEVKFQTTSLTQPVQTQCATAT